MPNHAVAALELPTCPICHDPAHAAESDDLDRHPRCVALEELRGRYGRDVVDRAVELVGVDAPDLDDDVSAIDAACAELAELDAAADGPELA